MPLLEKAYAQWNETGHEGRDGQNVYASLSCGWMEDVDTQVLGRAATTYCPAYNPAAEQAVIAALQSHEAVTAGIWVERRCDAVQPTGAGFRPCLRGCRIRPRRPGPSS